MSSEELEAEILIVDDTPANLDLLQRMLKDRFRVRAATSGRRALATARTYPIDLVLLDVDMPEMNGYEVCSELKADKATRDTPVIFVSALDAAIDKVAAFAAGGADYITKPFQIAEVMARIEYQLRLARLTRDLARKKAELEDANRQLAIANVRLRALSYMDGLTGVANRRRFDEALDEACAEASESGTPLSLVLIDLDHFKRLNDTQGHHAGDEALRAVASILAEQTNSRGGLAARFGGEEFAWLLPGLELDAARAEAEMLRIKVRDSGIVTASLGVAAGVTITPPALVAAADAALYRAKSGGRDRVES
ncbi:MAG TPA: diguanylate cyclase [Thermoanaerobaculia bacterium]|nr:diguanylate cyclase [Thermoanaerobaculia bacterium]